MDKAPPSANKKPAPPAYVSSSGHVLETYVYATTNNQLAPSLSLSLSAASHLSDIPPSTDTHLDHPSPRA